ncbi:MAG: class B sortase [Ruminiclostridium sp.]|nr:class B sortase [Ruminiclostridium sp.]
MSVKSRSKKFAAAIAIAGLLAASASCGDNTQAQDTADTSTEAPVESTTTAATTKAPLVTTTTTTTPPPLPVMTDEVPEDSWGQFTGLSADTLSPASYDSEEACQKVKDALTALGHDPKTFEEYNSLNENMIGWINIYIPNETDISEPVVQYDDNKYFLTHDFLDRVVKEGAIYADYKCKFTTRTRPANTILYGHNMASGKSFAKLTRYCTWYKYGQGISQYLAAPTITFDTIWEKGTYKVFAAMFVNTQTKNGTVFKYYKRRTIKNEDQFFEYIEAIMDRSQFYTDVDLEYGDEILTLSTCYYPLGKENADTRFVVFARRVRDGESPEVDTSKAVINPDPLYFKYYYQVNGGEWKGRNWDADTESTDTSKFHLKIKGYEEYRKTHETTSDAADTADTAEDQ